MEIFVSFFIGVIVAYISAIIIGNIMMGKGEARDKALEIIHRWKNRNKRTLDSPNDHIRTGMTISPTPSGLIEFTIGEVSLIRDTAGPVKVSHSITYEQAQHIAVSLHYIVNGNPPVEEDESWR